MKEKSKKVILKGIGASSGIAEGKVKILNTADEVDKMEAGDILVTSFTNPLFMPAIVKAAAIITEQGGVLCHAAIVAREIGIPCVVGTEKATTLLRDGMQILVDGGKGYVYIYE